MKTLLALLLTTLGLAAATSYPLLTDVPQRTFTGGGTNIAGLTNANTFTGTNTFSGTKTFVDGDTLAHQTPLRVLYSAPTNIYISAMATSSVAAVEVNGGYDQITPIFEGTLPALSSSNSLVYIAFTVVRPQANIGGGQSVAYVGTNTNYWGISGAVFPATRGATAQTGLNVLQSEASFTTASGTSSFASGTASLFPVATNLAGDLSQPWQFRYGAYLTTGNAWTNCWLAGFQIVEWRR